jgi:hypothetical protein
MQEDHAYLSGCGPDIRLEVRHIIKDIRVKKSRNREQNEARLLIASRPLSLFQIAPLPQPLERAIPPVDPARQPDLVPKIVPQPIKGGLRARPQEEGLPLPAKPVGPPLEG